MKVNGLAALGVWPVTVEIGQGTYRIPGTPAIGWIVPILGEDWLAIVPGMVDDESDLLSDALLDGDVSAEDCVNAARDAISAASGMAWWAAMRLVLSATQYPDISGELVARRIDAREVSLGAYTCATYWILARSCQGSKKYLAELNSRIEAPPPGVTLEQRWDPGAEAAGFMAMMQQRGQTM